MASSARAGTSSLAAGCEQAVLQERNLWLLLAPLDAAKASRGLKTEASVL